MNLDLTALLSHELPLLARAAVSLPVAAVLCAALAFRPRRYGTPKRDPEVIHTQVILGVVGAVVMLVIGESLARAFGIVGAAGLVRYRAKIEDPKDARDAAERILTSLGKPHVYDGASLAAPASIGVSVFPTDATNGEALLIHADAAMYAAKSTGRATYRFFYPADVAKLDLHKAAG